MNFFEKNKGLAKGFKKIPWLIFILFLLIVPSITKADGISLFSFGDLAYTIVSKAAFAISFVFDYIAGFFLMLVGYLLQVILSMNVEIVNSPVVRIGFPVALSLANLAMVLGIIVIAIATILDMQSYGLKNLLWKLLLMAVVINFGLIIAGAILNFSDQITLFFVRSTIPGQTSNNSGQNLSKFAETYASAFNPQRTKLFDTKTMNQKDIDSFSKAFSQSGNDFGAYLKPIVGVGLSLGVEIIMLIVLCGMVVMLLYRYIVVGLLLVGLPLAWAAWPFPAFKKHTKDWWNKFLKQAFFPPVMIFFLWLSLMVAQQLGDKGGSFIKLQNTSKNISGGFFEGISGFLGGISTNLIDSFLTAIILGGLSIAGLVAAQKFGAGFADNTLNAAKGLGQGAKKGISNYTRTRMARVGQASKQFAAGATAGTLRRIQPITRKLNPPLFNTGQSQIKLGEGGRAEMSIVPKIRSGQFVGADGKSLGTAVWDSKNQNYKEDGGGNYITKEGKSIDKTLVVLENAPTTVEGKVLSHDILDDKGRPKLAVKQGDKVVAGWVDSKGRLVMPKGIEGMAAAAENTEVKARSEMEKLRLAIEASPGMIGQVIKETSEGVSKGFKTGKHKAKTKKEIDHLLSELGVHASDSHDDDHGGGGHGGDHGTDHKEGDHGAAPAH